LDLIWNIGTLERNKMKTAKMSTSAKSIVLLKRPDGTVSSKLGEDIGLTESEAPSKAPETGGALVEIIYFSVDPYLRNSMNATLPVNAPIRGYVSGKIVDSNDADWKAGDLFGANLPFTTLQQVTKEDLKTFRNLTKYIKEEELSMGIGLLGMPGSTAYAGLDLMNVNENDRVWISAATGAVGSLAGEIAKNVKKCKLVIGSAGSDEKCRTAEKEFGYDACFNYRGATNADELTEIVKKHAPEGIDFYFENVGGDHFAAAMSNLREKGRVAVCGAISRYNSKGAPKETVNFLNLIYKQQRDEGFLCGDWLRGARGSFLDDMSKWYREGKIKRKETIYHGIEKWPEAFAALFTQGGDNLGKICVKVH
jgi:NADPH-dependent curcumin reductase CurA